MDGSVLTLYQPQVTAWSYFVDIEASMAVTLMPKAGGEQQVGAVFLKASTRTDMENRKVFIYDLKIDQVRFPSLDDAASARVAAEVRAIFPKSAVEVSLDRVLADLDRTEAQKQEIEVKVDPPRIFVSQSTAVLVIFDGEPILKEIEDTDLLYAVNTNWDVFFYKGAGHYYLRNEKLWLRADNIEGTWQSVSYLPSVFNALPDSKDWEETRAHLIPKPGPLPRVFVSTRPAELILIEGKPKQSEIPGTGLRYVTNTQADLFYDPAGRSYYFLVSGRWFKAADLNGPWTWTAVLPEGFARIPPDHERGAVLVSVPGTPQAEEAILTAQIPRTAVVKRDEVTLTVPYEGEPKFKKIEGTSMTYAVNTSYTVIKVEGRYYCCHEGVWFEAPGAAGPWAVCDSVPATIYTIPPSSPCHNVTYVTVYESSPTHVTCGYTAGYLGLYIAFGCVVYGSGWYYPPYYYRGIYYPYPPTYGFAAWYNPYTGTYGRGAVGYGPYGGAGRAATYNPRTRTYSRQAAAWGPYGGVWAGEAYNPRTNTYARGYREATPYARWGEGVVSRGDEWIHAGRYTDSRGTRSAWETSKGGAGVHYRGQGHSATIARDKNNNVYVGKDGHVYKKENNNWYRKDKGGWNQVDQADRNAVRQKAEAKAKERSGSAAGSRSSTAIGSKRNATTGTSPRSSGSRDVMHQLDRDSTQRMRGRKRQREHRSWKNSGAHRSKSGTRSRGSGSRSGRGN
ncbi:MAG: hypothetical protein QNK37_30425 [Acidobacteriota bacterium]|nr:hypothetical protein [Acidobacteriota bacterium]